MSTKELQTIVLADGRKVQFEQIKGRHIMAAQKACKKTPDLIAVWMMHKFCTIDGETMTIEDWQDLPAKDFNRMQLAMMGEDEDDTEGK